MELPDTGTGEALLDRLRSLFPAFPDQQIRMMLRYRHPSGACPRFDRGDIEQSIPDRFHQQVTRFPDRIAVQTGSSAITYAKLDEVSNQVAWQLLSTAHHEARV